MIYQIADSLLALHPASGGSRGSHGPGVCRMNILAAPVSLHSQESEGHAGEHWVTWFPGLDKPDMFLKPLAETSVVGPSWLALLQASLGPGQLLLVFLFIVVSDHEDVQ